MNPDERRARILDLLALKRGSVPMAQIMTVAGASEATVRRDLTRLVREGHIERTRGGAQIRSGRGLLVMAAHQRRAREHAREMREIAAAAVDLLSDGDTVFLGYGYTMFALAEEIARRKRRILVATPAVMTAEMLADEELCEVILIGGLLVRSHFGAIGPYALAAISALRTQVAFLSCDALSATGAWSRSAHDVEVCHAMAGQADRIVIASDHSKVHAFAPYRLFEWAEVDDLVVDSLPDECLEATTALGTRVHITSRSGETPADESAGPAELSPQPAS